MQIMPPLPPKRGPEARPGTCRLRRLGRRIIGRQSGWWNPANSHSKNNLKLNFLCTKITQPWVACRDWTSPSCPPIKLITQIVGATTARRYKNIFLLYFFLFFFKKYFQIQNQTVNWSNNAKQIPTLTRAKQENALADAQQFLDVLLTSQTHSDAHCEKRISKWLFHCLAAQLLHAAPKRTPTTGSAATQTCKNVASWSRMVTCVFCFERRRVRIRIELYSAAPFWKSIKIELYYPMGSNTTGTFKFLMN